MKTNTKDWVVNKLEGEERVEWIRHASFWRNCQNCHLNQTAEQHCIYRGSLPCDLLLVGEAPGVTEDVVGQPFVGPSGKFLDALLQESIEKLDLIEEVSYGITNIIACIPWGDKVLNTVRQPESEEVEECAPRLQQLLKIVKPKIVVLLGTTAKKYWKQSVPDCDLPVLELPHPAYILRKEQTEPGVMTARFVLDLSDFIEKNISPTAELKQQLEKSYGKKIKKSQIQKRQKDEIPSLEEPF